MKLNTCLYCGHSWTHKRSWFACIKCKDQNVISKDLYFIDTYYVPKIKKIDTYKGCPPFPTKQKSLDDALKEFYDLISS